MLKKISPNLMASSITREEEIQHERLSKFVSQQLNMENMQLHLPVAAVPLLLSFTLYRRVIILLFAMMFMEEPKDIWEDLLLKNMES